MVTTIVSSDMAFDIAKEYGLEIKEVLTGFKYIGEQIKLFEKTVKINFFSGLKRAMAVWLGNIQGTKTL